MREENRIEIVIGVITCPGQILQANGIRNTWGRRVPANVRVLYVYGRPGQAASLEDDVLYLDCPEAYEKLPEKMFRFFQFCAENIQFDYLLKIDDDSYVDTDRLEEFLSQGGDYIGHFGGIDDPELIRTWHYGKCTDKSYEVPYETEYVCDWARGGGYALSRKAVKLLAPRLSGHYKKHLLEDKMVGEALTPDTRITRKNVNCTRFGVVNPMIPANMLYVHQLTQALRLERTKNTTKMEN